MEHQTTLILLMLFAIALISFAFSFVIKALYNFRQQLESEKKKNDFYHFEVMNRLKMLCVSELTFLREQCIKEERYEEAKRLNEIMEKDMKDSISPEGRNKKEK